MIGIGLGLYTLFPFFQFYFLGLQDFGFSEASFWVENGLYYLALVYVLVLPFLMHNYAKEDRIPKSLLVLQKLKKGTFDKEFGFAMRIFALKFLFIPLMFLGALFFGEVALDNLMSLSEVDTSSWTAANWMNNYIFPCFFYSAMTFVLVIYAFGYCVESDLLNNRINSVDDSAFGWIVTIICYAPFFPLIAFVIPLGSQDFAFFLNHEVTAVVRAILIIIVSLKTWSIITLGTKSSNLTNRGIVDSGPYRWVRHPHYLTKMAVWWIGVVPSLIQNYWLIGGMIFWTTIYVLRALTEEQHLKRDPDYVSYMEKVKWRFIPGVF